MTNDLETNPETLVITPAVRQANWRLLVAMALFAVVLSVTCFLWMYGRMNGQRRLERAAGVTTSRPTEGTPANPSESPVAPR